MKRSRINEAREKAFTDARQLATAISARATADGDTAFAVIPTIATEPGTVEMASSLRKRIQDLLDYAATGRKSIG